MRSRKNKREIVRNADGLYNQQSRAQDASVCEDPLADVAGILAKQDKHCGDDRLCLEVLPEKAWFPQNIDSFCV